MSSEKKKEKRRLEAFYEQCRVKRNLWELRVLDEQRRGIKKTSRFVTPEQGYCAWVLRTLVAKAALQNRVEKSPPIVVPRDLTPRDLTPNDTTRLLHNKMNNQQRRQS
jgi:hypothetical protein